MSRFHPNHSLQQQVMEQSRAMLPADIVEYIEAVRNRPHPDSQLISVLHKVQHHFGHLDRTHMDAVAHLLGVPAAKISGVATFYHFFRLTPRGQYVINVCMGTACYVKGADKVLEKIREELGIDLGETTRDGLFSLEESRCLGTCGLAPVLMINEEVHAKVSPEQIPALLHKYASQPRAAAKERG
ncbi:MAG: NADH-quinone oxidoreductase subunit NuoE [Acidobacteria bacterium]|jgi:NADH:ubiquinone oxidoreductase subunit E|nr:NADH-quinone oxidoreductase subunit NuoE [Acidobacteriota bacterium]